MSLSGSQTTRLALGGPGLAYAGFTAKSAAEVITPSSIDWVLPDNKVHFQIEGGLVHWTIPDDER